MRNLTPMARRILVALCSAGKPLLPIELIGPNWHARGHSAILAKMRQHGLVRVRRQGYMPTPLARKLLKG